jgi:hypothetical protein
MVTRIVVLRRITPAERSSAAEDSIRDDDDNQLHHKKRNDDFDDDKYDTKIHHGETQLLCNAKGSPNRSKAADGEFCDDRKQNVDDVPSLCKSNDNTIDEGKAAEISRQDTNTSHKCPLLLEDDANNNGKNKRRRKRQQKFIDLTGVPTQLPIMSSRMDGSSKYRGVSFNKHAKKSQATIYINGKQHCIAYYDNEEVAAIDYARAVFKYTGAEITQRGRGGPSARQTEVQREVGAVKVV